MNLDKWYTGLSGKAGMILCTAGSRRMLINGLLYDIHRGTMCFMAPIISMQEISRSKDYKEVMVTDDVSVFHQSVRSVFSMLLKCRLRDTPYMLLSEEQINRFMKLYSEITDKEAFALTLPDDDERRFVSIATQLIRQQMMMVFTHLYYTKHRNTPATKAKNKNETVLIQFVYTLHSSTKLDRNVAHYAKEAGLSPNYFTRIIREKTGMTPSQFIAMVVIAKAKILLRQPNMNIKDVAAELNFPEQYTFRKFFKLHVGMSPTEYRKVQHPGKN